LGELAGGLHSVNEPLLPFFEWCEQTWLGTLVRDSVWAFPVIESVHLLGLSLLGGAILIVDLRLLGFTLTRQRIHDLARAARPWLIAGVCVMLTTGLLLFLSEAVKCYYNTSFRVKMVTLPIALLYTFVLKARFTRDPSLDTSRKSRLLAAGSIALWFVVAAAGRWIGFS
jgi:hypothetical protein